MIVGYARVSTRDQNESRQIIALKEAGVETSNIFIDKQSGKDFDRVNYKRMLKTLKPGDVIFVKSIDRLGRNYEEILNEWKKITKDMKVDIVIIDMPLLDTRNSRDLTGTLIADIVLQLLSYVADCERSAIKQRQAEGIAAAKARGVAFGRPCKKRPREFDLLMGEYLDGNITSRDAGKKLGISHTTFIGWVNSASKK